MNKKGFTIIELIVVIAIIAVLAGIVLVNVTSYINKGRNAAIQGNLATLLTNGAVYFDLNASNTGSQFCADTATGGQGPITSAITNAKGTSYACNGSSTAGHQVWCTKVTLPDSTAWCVDSTGYKGSTSTNCTASNFCCNSTASTCL